MDTYALILLSRVINVVVALEEEVGRMVDDGTIDSFVLLSDGQLVNIGDAYEGGEFSSFVPDLATAKKQKLAEFQLDIQTYMDERYSLMTRVQIMNLYTLSKFHGFTNRCNYLETGMNWVNSIISYGASFASLVQCQIHASDVVDLRWSIETNILADPKIKLATAVQIQD